MYEVHPVKLQRGVSRCRLPVAEMQDAHVAYMLVDK